MDILRGNINIPKILKRPPQRSEYNSAAKVHASEKKGFAELARSWLAQSHGTNCGSDISWEWGVFWAGWGAAIVSSGFVTILVLAGGYALKATIEQGIQHGLDRELEKLKAQLQEKGEQISAIRNGALSVLASRHEALVLRRLKAAEALWNATLYQSKFKMAVQFVSAIKLDAVIKASTEKTNDAIKIKEFGDALWKSSGIEKIVNEQPPMPDIERLFVPPLAWAAFSAYRSVTGSAAVVLATMRAGLGADLLKSHEEIIQSIKVLLPHQAKFLDDHPDTGIYFLADELQEKIFSQIVSSFSASESDRWAVDQAAMIVTYAEASNVAEIPPGLPEQFLAEKPDIAKA